MSFANPCIIWDPVAARSDIPAVPMRIAEALDAPLYMHYSQECDTDRIESIGDESLFSSLIMKTPLRETFLQMEYAFWKPPKEHDCFITRGPKSIHTTQHHHQRHIHIFNGTYRGFFLTKDKYEEYQGKSEVAQFLLGLYRFYTRAAIQSSVHTIDTVVVDSELTRDVVKSIFGRSADAVIYPPVPVEKYSPELRDASPEPYYLYLGVIDDHHRTQEIVEAFNDIPYRLKIAGEGEKMSQLQGLAGDNIEFCGYVTGEEKRKLLANCKAIVNPTNHSFGKVLVESLASGRPIISVDEGYAPYIVSEGETGILYDRGTENLRSAIEKFEDRGINNWDTVTLTDTAEEYSIESFQSDWRELILEE